MDMIWCQHLLTLDQGHDQEAGEDVVATVGGLDIEERMKDQEMQMQKDVDSKADMMDVEVGKIKVEIGREEKVKQMQSHRKQVFMSTDIRLQQATMTGSLVDPCTPNTMSRTVRPGVKKLAKPSLRTHQKSMGRWLKGGRKSKALEKEGAAGPEVSVCDIAGRPSSEDKPEMESNVDRRRLSNEQGSHKGPKDEGLGSLERKDPTPDEPPLGEQDLVHNL